MTGDLPDAPSGTLTLPPEIAQLPLEPARLPGVLLPMAPGGVSEPFDSPDHLFEVRWDGLRGLAFIDGGGYHLQDQSGRNITELFPELSEVLHNVAADQVILDGVVVVTDENGKPDFGALDRRMRMTHSGASEKAAHQKPAAFIVFDILYVEARSVMALSLLRRRRLLREVVKPGGRLALCDAVAGEGVAFFDAAREMGIEAVIAKRKDSPYLPGGRPPSWLLVQDVPRQDAVVVGYIPDTSGNPFESILVGVFQSPAGRDPEAPAYVGAVGGGFDRATERLLAQALPGMVTAAGPPQNAERVPAGAVWVRPELVVSVKFSQWTEEGMMRFPIFVGLHPEVNPHDARRHPVVASRERVPRRKLHIELPQLPFAED